jgi:2-desacetyl-2-hydroxyethyl bacteriochlorophyllide A dehydrogenase
VNRDSRALWIEGRARAALRPTSLPTLGAGDVVVRMTASGISRGTERLVFWGRVPESLRDGMRCPFQDGDFPWPVKYGYGAVGRIDSGARVGERVFALHPHQELFVIPGNAAIAIPDAVPDARATLAANMETALNAIWDAELKPAARICVIGAGVVGLLVAALAQRETGAAVRVVDPDPDRVALARALGLDAAGVAVGEWDVIFHASGNPDGLVDALAIAAFEARIVELSWYGDRPVSLPLGAAFHARRLRIIASQVGHVAPSMRASITPARRLAMALELLAQPRFDRLLGPRVAFADLPERLGALLESNPTPPHVVVTY